ncbi:Do family serine endopeptidase [Wenzhouxiangella marina]|uniref:Heat-shock protein n=1 Tax=Wenzhouxiangella marina TaxID=1579979 RepID=A0A0K0XT38_9GAMM|nr:Do family serine endopeptidase [Wenzhouxiangella marina]AKS40781.1 Heat-shock protein [Wenzhouxiangella marina]MBB6087654.1 Do/DeqQ family serine protease [Wenzhouxiangella marina]
MIKPSMFLGLVLLPGLLLPMLGRAALPAEVDGQHLPSLAPVLEGVTPAVVNISTRTRVQVRTSPFFDDPFFRRFFDMPSMPRERIQQSLGSGVIVDAEAGYILTNNHVIDGADDIAVTLQDGREFVAEYIGSDRDTDLAVVRIEAENLAELPLDDRDGLRVGDFVVAVGNPFGLGQTVTSGIVSALGRSGLRGLEYQNFIQTDASINPGNSGGALIDLAGRLIGINTAIFTPSGGNVGIGFAIPASTAAYVMDQLLAYGEVRRGSLGVEVQDLSTELREALELERIGGAVVTRLGPESALAEAGLRAGDVIVGIDRRPVENTQGLRNIEGLLSVGSEVDVVFVREGEEREVRVLIEEDLDARISGRRLDERLDGVVLARLPDRTRAQGSLIEEVRRNSAAWEAGLRAGDVIVAINRQTVRSLRELRGQFPVESSRELAIEIRRRGRAYLAVLK